MSDKIVTNEELGSSAINEVTGTKDGNKNALDVYVIGGLESLIGGTIPAGGTTGQHLAKSSNDPYDTEWVDAHEIPAGGTTGQVLAKVDNDDYDVEWIDVTTSPGGSDTHAQYNDGGVFGGDANYTWNKTTKKLTTKADGLAAIPTTSHLLENATAALTGSRIQASPATQWSGRGWKTNSVAGSQSIDYRAFALPITASVNPIAQWKLQSSVNGGSYSDAIAYQNQVQDGVSTGLFTVTGFGRISGNNSSTIDTLQNFNIVNPSGSRTHLTYTFGSTIRYGITSTDTAQIEYKAAGTGATHNFFVGSAIGSQAQVMQVYAGGIYVSGNGLHTQVVTAGSGDTSAQTTLSTYGSFAATGKLITDSSYTLAQTETFVYVDPSNANVCAGTATACNTYLTESPCNTHSGVGCSWFSGNSCNPANGTDAGTCTGQGAGCTWAEAPCSGANNTDQSTCENQDDAYGGSCSWDTSTCPSLTNQGACEGQTGCTWNFSSCVDFNGNSQATCEGNSGCSWTGAACSAFDATDQSTCETGHTGCTWDSGNSLCVGTYDEASTCAGQYNTSCTGDLCAGNYNTGDCTGTYGAYCQGSANCANLTDDGISPCNAEAGCTWTVGVTITLPTTANASRGTTGRVYSIIHVGETGTVNIVGQSGQPIFQYTTLPLLKKGDKVLLHNQNITFQCSIFVTSTPCSAQTGCTWRNCPSFGDQPSCDGAGCAWDSDNNVCTGGTSCVGTYSNGAHWYAHSLERGLNYAEKTSAYTLTSIDDVINCTSGTFALTLPSAPLNNGKKYEIKNTGAGVITLSTTSSQTIDGNASGVLTLNTSDSMTVISNNVNWVIV